MRWLLAIGETALLCWFLSVGLEAMLQRQMGMRSPFRMREWHHAYVGGLLVLLGWYLRSPTGCFLQLLGLVLTFDDDYQHTEQTLNGDIEFMSPLHRLFGATLWRVPGVPALVRFLDRWWLAGAVLALVGLWLFT